ncbi:MAG: 23S rRNA (pseudouridine(1915)-N(3))-methyltransferase RlmH [Mariprofundales bacterium]|nr:23S rRNA (pseudouridine(1915)-N(3))-methyltransferase RlmH [Mariprofundales bacterium]
MKQRLLVVGRGDSELADYEKRFMHRICSFTPFEVIELQAGKEKRIEQRRQQEGVRIRKRCQERTMVLFDERGRRMTSQHWASFLRDQPGSAEIDYVIGGAGGVEDNLRNSAAQCWQLSALTLPHQLVRTLVLEQLYRAQTILAGHPYHRE